MVDTSDRRRIAIGVLVIALGGGAGMGYLVARRGDDADPSVGTEVTAVDDGEDRSSPGPRLDLVDGLRPRPSCPIGGEPVEPGRGEVLPKPINNGFVALHQTLTVTGDVLGDTAPEAVRQRTGSG